MPDLVVRVWQKQLMCQTLDASRAELDEWLDKRAKEQAKKNRELLAFTLDGFARHRA